ADALTASIHEPQCRGADHAVFERRIVGDKARLKEITAALVDDVSPRWTQAVNPAMHREEIVDIRGMAQAIMLLEHSETPPAFVAHEFVLTDGAGHEFGPHHEGLREALYRTDRRIGALLEMMRRRGILDSTLFVITSDHGMAAQRVELAANPTVEPARMGIKAVYAEPMIYLRDLAIECTRTRDARMLRVKACDNDCHEPVEGVRVKIERRNGETIGEASTSGTGHVALATPANLRDDELVLRITHPDYNPRNVDGCGRPIHRDIREVIYSG
ncbi:MAG TPA: alkaline phosphatase family protein, partial [Candidatus Binataceae bacterium]|nr:alkaline phosphatase family protein [Candidatus Binataceae bacterium]